MQEQCVGENDNTSKHTCRHTRGGIMNVLCNLLRFKDNMVQVVWEKVEFSAV